MGFSEEVCNRRFKNEGSVRGVVCANLAELMLQALWELVVHLHLEHQDKY